VAFSFENKKGRFISNRFLLKCLFQAKKESTFVCVIGVSISLSVFLQNTYCDYPFCILKLVFLLIFGTYKNRTTNMYNKIQKKANTFAMKLTYITNLVCYTYFHWFFSPECQHIFGKQTGYIFQSPKKIKTYA
jgi:hypothetical protein